LPFIATIRSWPRPEAGKFAVYSLYSGQPFTAAQSDQLASAVARAAEFPMPKIHTILL